MRFFEKRQPQGSEREITAEILAGKKLTKVHGRRVWGQPEDGGARIEHAFDWHLRKIVTIEEFNREQARRFREKPAREPHEVGGLSGRNLIEDEQERRSSVMQLEPLEGLS